jgi:hypothetical protein
MLKHAGRSTPIATPQRASNTATAYANDDVRIEASTSPDGFALAATVTTIDGEFITAGLADIITTAADWTVRLSRLDRPGVIASMFFGEHLRDVLIRLEDGREGRARIARTTFVAGQERQCRLIGLTPLATPSNL